VILQLRTLLTDPVVNNLSLRAAAMRTLRIIFRIQGTACVLLLQVVDVVDQLELAVCAVEPATRYSPGGFLRRWYVELLRRLPDCCVDGMYSRYLPKAKPTLVQVNTSSKADKSVSKLIN
jgi:hypothetical protein